MSRILIVMPTWVGDVVMATPALRALREQFPDARIIAMSRSVGRDLLDPCPWLDQIIDAGEQPDGPFDLGVLLSNSFRAAVTAKRAGCLRIVGYARDLRSWMLTDQLLPPRGPMGYEPIPALDYYLQIAHYLGAKEPSTHMELFAHEEDEARVDALLRDAGCNAAAPLVLLNPGASFGPAKMWAPDRFAAVSDRLVQEHGVQIALTGSPAERRVIDHVAVAAQPPVARLDEHGIDLKLLKSVVKRAALLITNDTGPRHIAAAFGVPVVTLFGPTDPRWTEIGFDKERQIMIDVFCGPCQRKQCPLDHRCMTRITTDMVFERAAELLSE